MRALVVCSVLFASGCVFQAAPGVAPIACQSSADCPAPLVCLKGLCATRSEDVTPPELVGSATVTPTLARAGDTVTVTLTANEPLAKTPLVQLVFEGGTALVLEPDATARRFTRVLEGSEPQSRGRVQVELTDVAGNAKTYPDVGSVRLDFEAPRAGLATVAFDVPAGSLIPSLEALGPGGTALVAFSLDEAPASLALRSDPDVFSFAAVDSGTSLSTFRATLSASARDAGTAQVLLDVSDVVGNHRTEPLLLSRPLAFDTEPPDFARASLQLERAPWGTTASVTPLQRVAAAQLEPQTLLRLVDGKSGVELGRVRVDVDGGALLDLPSPDRNDVRAELIDSAANVSPRVVVARTQYVLTAPEVPTSESPRLLDVRTASARLRRPEATVVPGRQPITTSSAGSFSMRINGDPNGACNDTALAYSESEAAMVGFSGSYFNNLDNGTFVFNGQRWARLPLSVSPTPMTRALMVYDRDRDTLVVVGDPNGSLWERSDGVWRNVQVRGPLLPRRNALFVSTRHGSLLLGGLQASGQPISDAWRWTGDRWLSVDAGALPLQGAVGAGNDEGLAALLLSADGGNPSTYFTDGVDFWPANVDGGPPSTNGQLTYDPTQHQWLANVDSLNGNAASVYALGDAGWARLSSGHLHSKGPSVFDEQRGTWDLGWCNAQHRLWTRDGGVTVSVYASDIEPVRSGAASLALPDAGWLIAGGYSWDNRANFVVNRLRPGATRFERFATMAPGQELGSGVAMASTNAGLLVCGGVPDYNQPVTDKSWLLLADGGVVAGPTVPAPVTGHSLTATAHKALLLGVARGAPLALETDGTSWTRLDGGFSIALHAALQAPDAPDDVIVVGGSSDTNPDLTQPADPFIRRVSRVGSALVTSTIGTLVQGRRSFASAWDTKRRGFFLWGGNNVGGLGDLERVDFDGGLASSRSVPVSDPEGDAEPTPRNGSVMFYDPVFDGLVMTLGGNGGNLPFESWEYKEAGARAAVQFEASLASLELSRSTPVTLHVEASLQGTGGAQLWLWKNRRWQRVATVSGAASQQVQLDVPDVRIDELGPRHVLALSATSIASHDLEPVTVTLDRVQVTLSFVRQ